MTILSFAIQTVDTGIIWETVRNADPGVLFQTHWVNVDVAYVSDE